MKRNLLIFYEQDIKFICGVQYTIYIVGLRGRVLFSQCKMIGPSVIPLSLSDKRCGTQRLDRGGPLMHRPIPKSASDENLCIMFHEKGLWLRLDYYTRWMLLLVEG